MVPEPGFPEPQPHEELVRQAVAGDHDALSALLAAFGPRIEAVLQIGRPWRSTLDPGDVMQVTYLEAFMQISKFRPEQANSFEAWLRRIAENNLRDAIRSMERLKKVPERRRLQTSRAGDESFVGLLDVLVANSSTPSRTFARSEVRALVQSVLRQLPEEYARVVQLYDLDGKTINEVSQALGRSTGAVHMLRARAHDRMSQLLEMPSTGFFN